VVRANFFGGVFAFFLTKRRQLHIPGYYWPGFIVILIAGYEYFRPPHGEWLICLLGFAIPQFDEIRNGSVERVSHTIAKYSYGIYLANVPVITLFTKHFTHVNQGLRWAGLVVSLGAISMAGYHLVERPMIKLGHRVADRIARNPKKRILDVLVAEESAAGS
jgi:peptidoglycan/LPS O-acetylase OafA/YrhL